MTAVLLLMVKSKSLTACASRIEYGAKVSLCARKCMMLHTVESQALFRRIIDSWDAIPTHSANSNAVAQACFISREPTTKCYCISHSSSLEERSPYSLKRFYQACE